MVTWRAAPDGQRTDAWVKHGIFMLNLHGVHPDTSACSLCSE